MPPVTNARCRACQSPHRADIDGRLLNGESTRAVSAWLEKTHGEKIDFSNLANHRRAHLDTLGEAKERLDDAKLAALRQREEARQKDAEEHPAFEASVKQTLDVVETLDLIASEGLEMARAAKRSALVASPIGDMIHPDVSSAVASIWSNGLKTATTAMVEKQALLEGRTVNVNAALTSSL